nr:4Fe-4S dicluster domain-containing protein [Candidatus Sigynarchaeum springense]MDO8115923.1 4Fe-4S dicluster domain-containing protein [Candidatus Sigynarchaeota archaeon]
MPILLMKAKRILFFQKNRCQGCEMCVVACPTGVLDLSDEYNMRAAQVPRVKPGKEKSCILCQRCEFACPNWAIYVIDEQPGEKKLAGEGAKV